MRCLHFRSVHIAKPPYRAPYVAAKWSIDGLMKTRVDFYAEVSRVFHRELSH